jgi:2-methylcitrate dehydratase PrpD
MGFFEIISETRRVTSFRMTDEGYDSTATLSHAATWLAQLNALPVEVEAKARLLLLDTFGCLLAGLRHPKVRQFGKVLQLAFPGDTAWPASDIKLGAAGIAALGAAAACWDEACEGNSSAHGRPGLPVVPSLLALSATQDISLGDLLVALVTGYEIGARAGELWRIPPGWHVDGSWHSLSVAAAVARLTSGPRGIQPAMEAAACQIPASLYLPIATGSVLRNTYPAHAVLLGMLSAAAATAGFEMPHDAFEEGRRRVLRATSPASATPSGQWTILAGYLKPFAGVRHTHYGVEAALHLRKHREFSLERIKVIRLQTYEEAVQYCGNRAPWTAIQAQFSLSYAIAAALVLGDLGPNAYDDIDDPIIKRLEQSVVVEVEQGRLRRGAGLTIDIGGKSLTERVEVVAGDPAMPMTKDQVVGKFRRYVEPMLGKEDVGSLVRFFLEGDSAQPARTCFTFGR